jgi:hypothetical protein
LSLSPNSADRDEHIRHEPCTCGGHLSRLIFSKLVNAVSLPLFEQLGRNGV